LFEWSWVGIDLNKVGSAEACMISFLLLPKNNNVSARSTYIIMIYITKSGVLSGEFRSGSLKPQNKKGPKGILLQ
jgi:hypothetical protein